MTHRITSHKGGRTARAPEARIRPQTLQRIHAEMKGRGKSFADLLEEQYSGDDTMADKNQTQQKNLKDDYEYLITAAKSAPTKKERDWAKRQLKRLEKSK